MRISKKSIAVGVLAASLVLGGAASAQAGTTLQGFNLVAPKFQYPVYTAGQTKAISSFYGLLDQVTTGGGYQVNAKECVGSDVSCGSTVTVNGGAHLPNNISAGTLHVVAQMWVNTFNFVSVSVAGYWASN